MCDRDSSGMSFWGSWNLKTALSGQIWQNQQSELLQWNHMSTELVSLLVRKQNAQSEAFQGNLGTAKLQIEKIRKVSASE